MNTKKHIVLYINFCALLLVFLAVFNSCTRKEVKINIVEVGCKKIKIKQATYTRQIDPSCGDEENIALYNITFKHNSKEECIYKLKINAEAFDANNTKIEGISYPEEITKDESIFTINDDSITFQLEVAFRNKMEADQFNHLLVSLVVENSIQTQSNQLRVRINGKCSTISPDDYKIVKKVSADDETIEVKLWDDAAEDGDIVTVYLNGQLVLENHLLSNEGHYFLWKINPGKNDLVLIAVNEGSSGPNTVALSINGGSDIELSPDLLTGEAVEITF